MVAVPSHSPARRTLARAARPFLDPAGLRRFGQRVLVERNLYGALAFAETAESLRLCQHALQVGPRDRVAGICSSGDVLLSLAAHRPKHVIGFDVNPTQVALARLKQVAMQHLSVDDYLRFFGVTEAPAAWRLETFDRLTRALPAPSRRLLLARRGWVAKGILNHGMTHLIIRALAATVRRLVDEETWQTFMGEGGTAEERAARLARLLERRSVRRGLEPFARRFAGPLKWLFFPHKLCRVSTRPDQMIAEFFDTFEPLFLRGARANPVLARSAAGVVNPEWTTHLYNEEVFAAASQDTLRFESAELTEGLRRLPDGWATRLYLSNAPDYFTNPELDAFVREVNRVTAPGARILHFSLLDEDRIGDRIGAEAPEAETLRASDNVHLYPTIALRIA